MNRLFFVLALAAFAFAQNTWEDTEFTPEELSFSEEEIQEIQDTEEVLVIEDAQNVSEVHETQSEILLSVNEKSKAIVFDFSKSDTEKIVKIVCISAGSSIMEISVDSSQKMLDIPTQNLRKGIYIIRILSRETQKSILSKAIVVG